MANRVKEDEKNEKIIRGLLKLPANRRCINCNSLGPQYVCTNFSIFICTNCSGIHREFTHRVKSVSMAKFTLQEVSNLQEGGNERAREIFFKEWDMQRNTFPDSSNVERLRTFIKHVYVDRRFTGEKPVDKPPRIKGDKDDYEQRKMDTFRSGSRSPPYEDGYDRRYNDRPGFGSRNDERNFRYSSGERSPGYDRGDYRRSPGHFEVVDDRRRDDKGISNQNWKFEDRRFPDGVPKPEGSSPNHPKSTGTSPVVRPMRDILGDDAPALHVGEPTKPNVAPVIEGPPTIAPSSSSGSAVVNPTSPQQKTPDAASLIDFDADDEPSVSVTSEQPAAQSTINPARQSNWASFDSITVPNAPQNTANLNSFVSVLSELSDSGNVATATNLLPTNVGTDVSPLNVVAQLPNVKEPSLFSEPSNPNNVPPFVPFLGGPSDQPGLPPVTASVPASHTAYAGQVAQVLQPPKLESNTAVSLLPNADVKQSGRKELPMDLFTSSYPTNHPSMMAWHGRPNFGMALPMQYPVVMPSFSYQSKSANPFDVSSDPTLSHAATFPSLASLHGVLPNPVNSSDIMQSGSFGASPLPQPMAQDIPGGYTGQQFQSNIRVQQFQGNIPQQMPNTIFPVGSQGMGNVPNQMSFGPMVGMNPVGFSQTGTTNAFRPSSSNPFG